MRNCICFRNDVWVYGWCVNVWMMCECMNDVWICDLFACRSVNVSILSPSSGLQGWCGYSWHSRADWTRRPAWSHGTCRTTRTSWTSWAWVPCWLCKHQCPPHCLWTSGSVKMYYTQHHAMSHRQHHHQKPRVSWRLCVIGRKLIQTLLIGQDDMEGSGGGAFPGRPGVRGPDGVQVSAFSLGPTHQPSNIPRTSEACYLLNAIYIYGDFKRITSE